jgi:hypothetical protein
MAPKHHPVPLSGGDRKALAKEIGRPRDDDDLATRSAEAQTNGEALIRRKALNGLLDMRGGFRMLTTKEINE